jgi:hypothetical protein
VSSYDHIKAGALSRPQQVTVAERIPSLILCLDHCVAWKAIGYTRRRDVIKQYEHLPEERRALKAAHRDFARQTQVPH